MHNIETILNIKGNENACRALASRIQPILQENLTLQSEEFDSVVVSEYEEAIKHAIKEGGVLA